MSCSDTPIADLCLTRGVDASWTLTIEGGINLLNIAGSIVMTLREEEELDAPVIVTIDGFLVQSRPVNLVTGIYAHDILFGLGAKETAVLPAESCWYVIETLIDSGESVRRHIQGRMTINE